METDPFTSSITSRRTSPTSVCAQDCLQPAPRPARELRRACGKFLLNARGRQAEACPTEHINSLQSHVGYALACPGVFPQPLAWWQPERNQLARVVAAADREHDILLPVEHVRHGRAGLPSRNINRADFLACGLVVGAQHRAPHS